MGWEVLDGMGCLTVIMGWDGKFKLGWDSNGMGWEVFDFK